MCARSTTDWISTHSSGLVQTLAYRADHDGSMPAPANSAGVGPERQADVLGRSADPACGGLFDRLYDRRDGMGLEWQALQQRLDAGPKGVVPSRQGVDNSLEFG
ncbi:MAG: hypothetical protein JXA89_14200 [Anaerolineae bacterium]|nr:hypothetical protein [Anaerolineae bacterium]